MTKIFSAFVVSQQCATSPVCDWIIPTLLGTDDVFMKLLTEQLYSLCITQLVLNLMLEAAGNFIVNVFVSLTCHSHDERRFGKTVVYRKMEMGQKLFVYNIFVRLR
jgi:hypothetical protein